MSNPHPFTLSGFGPGPFRVVYMLDNVKRAHTGLFADLIAGGTCAHCGTVIRYEFGIECQTTGARHHVGSSCVEKTDSELFKAARAMRRDFNAMLRDQARKAKADEAEQAMLERFHADVERFGLDWVLDFAESELDMFEVKRLRDAVAAMKRFGIDPERAERLHQLRPVIERRALAYAKPHGILTVGKGTFTGEVTACWLQDSMYGATVKVRVWDLDRNVSLICTAPRALLDMVPHGCEYRQWLPCQTVTLAGTIETPYRSEPGSPYGMKRPTLKGEPKPLEGWRPNSSHPQG